MGYVFNFHDAIAYEQWFNKPQNRFFFDLEKRLMLDMLKPVRGDSVIDIGCGTGANLLSFVEMGLQVTGLDPSPYMLDVAAKKLGNRADLHRGFAEDLPFDDNSFNYACLVTTLEFVENPQKALEEACRITKDKIFIGVLNRYAIKGIQRRIKGMFIKTVYNRAKFFSVWELKQIIRTILGDVPISWRTTCQLPVMHGNIASRIEHSLLQRCPFGAFAGMVVTLVPRYKTRTLPLRYNVKRTTDTAAG
ncbi:MAG: class I SAM-dependent methyltransferase [Desulfobacterales bacterium]|nr:class I SAM-dependent methyltransferase [Desulfobacterales bacterium]